MRHVLTRFRRRDRGQSMVFSVLTLTALLLMTAATIDGGNWLRERRNLQGGADAAALAAVRELATGGSPRAVAEEYVYGHNATDQAELALFEIIDGSKVKVGLQRTSPGFFSRLAGLDSAEVGATATARALQARGMPAALPFAFMRDGYTIGAMEEIKVDDNLGPGNRGIVSLRMESSGCNISSGGQALRDAIINGTACPMEEGTTIETQTGNVWGQVRSALDQRIGSNTQSFNEVYEYDETTGRHAIADYDSPRIGVVPIVENPDGTTAWPSGNSTLVIVGYMLVYIGKMDEYPYPPYTHSTKSVWVTPVRAVLPEDFNAVFGDTFDPNSDAPVTFRLVD